MRGLVADDGPTPARFSSLVSSCALKKTSALSLPCPHGCGLQFALVLGIDLSAAETFVRMQRLLSECNVVLVICGAGDEKTFRVLESDGLTELPDIIMEFSVTFNDDGV